MKILSTAALACLQVMLAGQSSSAQSPNDTRGPASAVGVVVDSVRGGFLANAIISASPGGRTGITDSLGQFRIDSLPLGAYTLRLAHAFLDTVGISVVTRPTQLAENEATAFVLAIPSASTIVARKCSASELRLGNAAIAGTVVDADTEEPAAGATVVVEWTDYEVGKKTLGRTPQRRAGEVRTDGSYLVCGIPSDLATGVRAIKGGESTASVTVNFERGLAVRSFAIPRSISRDAQEDSSGNDRARESASLRGNVVGPDGKALAGVRVAIEEDSAAAVSDALGHFTLTGARSGTRALTVRKIGFQPVEVGVDVSRREVRSVTVQLHTTVRVLESVRITAMRDIGLQRVGFAERKRLGMGKYYSPQDIESRNPLRLSYLLEMAPMLRSGRTNEGNRYITGRHNGCVRYYLDGRLTMDAHESDLLALPDSYLSTSELGAVEVYDNLSAPAEYLAYRGGAPCSVVVIWTKWKLGIR